MAPVAKATPFQPRIHPNVLHSTHRNNDFARKLLHERRTFTRAARYLDLSRANGKRSSLLTKVTDADDTLFDGPVGPRDGQERFEDDTYSSEEEDWDDGKTLVSKFMKVDLADISKGKISIEQNKQVEALEAPFNRMGSNLKLSLGEVLGQALTDIKFAHDDGANTTGLRFQHGIVKFSECTPEFVNSMIKQQTEFEHVQAEAKDATLELFKKLKDAYDKKSENKLRFMFALKEKVEALLDGLGDFEVQLQEAEAQADKRLKTLKKKNQEQHSKNVIEYLRTAG